MDSSVKFRHCMQYYIVLTMNRIINIAISRNFLRSKADFNKIFSNRIPTSFLSAHWRPNLVHTPAPSLLSISRQFSSSTTVSEEEGTDKSSNTEGVKKNGEAKSKSKSKLKAEEKGWAQGYISKFERVKASPMTTILLIILKI